MLNDEVVDLVDNVNNVDMKNVVVDELMNMHKMNVVVVHDVIDDDMMNVVDMQMMQQYVNVKQMNVYYYVHMNYVQKMDDDKMMNVNMDYLYVMYLNVYHVLVVVYTLIQI